MKKWGWPGSLCMLLVLLVFICTLPALALVAYRAVDDYQAAATRDSNCPAAFLHGCAIVHDPSKHGGAA